MEHPITPPPELVEEWFMDQRGLSEASRQHITTAAARWGADQELESCCEWIPKETPWDAEQLRIARRPKLPSLRKQAYDALDTYIYGEPDPKDKERTYNTIRRALEALPND